jgi:peptide chain release factor 3
MAEFEKSNSASLAIDAEGHLSFLAASEWRLGHCMEQWPQIDFLKTRDLN